ncbi:MAG TPA: 4-alpha-glucanotransferase [Xanthobacteraceae bacterium]|jgi:4-alpha-glucanotransferase
MDDLSDRAARAGVATEYWDGVGELHRVAPDVLSRVLEALAAGRSAARRSLPGPIVIRDGSQAQVRLNGPEGVRLRWEVLSDSRLAHGETISPLLKLPEHLPYGLYGLTAIADGEKGGPEEAPLIVAPRRAHQGDPAAPRRMWALAVQLYALRSRRNWGHGDFSDLLELIDAAADLGAAAIGLNPLHCLMDDRMEEPSPYFPNSRLFLNALYIDVEAIPEFPGIRAAGLEDELRRPRGDQGLDYRAVASLKTRGMEIAYAGFRAAASPQRRGEFDRFREHHAHLLFRFACFEFLRRKFGRPWWEWPQELREGTAEALASLRESEPTRIGFFEFVQWVAHEQLAACRLRAHARGMPIGLYLDIAVGVRSDGFDAWCDQDVVLRGLAVGAPPDALNSLGQNWGLAGFNPLGLEQQRFEPFRQLLQAAMRYAGAVRLDHVLGLRRLYVIPHGISAKDGTYIQLPFDALLATAALASVQQQCVLVGEDLGTVPENFRETLMDWGIWSYQVMLFERTQGGGFASPDTYRENALVTFATHDLPTFAGWRTHRDLLLKRALDINPGETDEDRRRALDALELALRAHGIEQNDFAAVTRYLADTPSRLLVISLEDLLGVQDQVNLPGTVDEHPNWRQVLPVALEELRGHPALASVADVLRSAGRSCC